MRCGLTPAAVIVMVVVATGGVFVGGFGVGVVGVPLLLSLLPPHPAAKMIARMMLDRRFMRCLISTEQ